MGESISVRERNYASAFAALGKWTEMRLERNLGSCGQKGKRAIYNSERV